MVDELVIVDATHDQLLRWLQDLVVLARDEQRKNPLRPQDDRLAGLTAARIDPYQLPIYLRARQKRIFGIYSGPRAAASPFVPLLVRVSVEELLPRTLRLELECDADFPVTQSEVRWHLLQRFPNHELPAAPHAGDGAEAGLLRPPGHRGRPDDADPPPGSVRVGAPVLSCNEWLEEQLAQCLDVEQRRALYRPWLERYRALRGYYPADPRRSFRAAVAGCLHRLARQGKMTR